MSAMAETEIAASPRSTLIHPAWVRITHWINAVAMIIMIGSGWQIYNASPLFNFTFPVGIGGWLAAGIMWHLAAMWVLVINGLIYLALGLASGRFRTRFFPISAHEVVSTMRDAAAFKLSHADLSVYNAVQKLLYAGVLVCGALVVLSGLSMWKPVQLQWLTALFGGYDVARYVHFIMMAAIVAFIVVHVALALIVPKSVRAMITGR